MDGDEIGVVAEGTLLFRQLGSPVVVGELVDPHGILRDTPEIVAVGGQAVVAAVRGRNDETHHFLVGVAQVAGLGGEEGLL
ncbi:hypothetical protein SDC9_165481 [bioreactor metagenome]|uniref:Uncharacterized protein n=1 Tax=bioreactor metagenome TaxID=1076179 RepID=A0A645G1P9_9ZZZZ